MTAEARVIGAIGAVSDELRGRLRRLQPDAVEHDLGTAPAVLLSSGVTTPWRAGPATGVLWSPQAAAPVASWVDAMHEAGAPGLAVSSDEVVLHSSAWGVQPLHVARLDDATIAFASRIQHLVDLLEGPLDPDWDAWASILTFNHPLNGRTPFAHIAHLRGGESVHVDRRSGALTQRRALPRRRGLDREPATAHEVVDALRTAIAEHPALTGGAAPAADYLASLPLSGGWDSRMVGALAVQVHGPDAFLALTTAKHTDGADPDVTFAVGVARHLGLTHEVLLPDGHAHHRYSTDAFASLEHETWEHAWLQPTAATLGARGLPVLDGLAGDTLMKNNARTTALLESGVDDLDDKLWSRLAKLPRVDDLPAFGAGVREALTERGRSALVQERHGLEDEPEQVRLVLLRTRMVHGISLSPFKLIGSGTRVVTPALHPDVVDALMSIPWQQKSRGALARRVLEAVQPGLTALPSTNDRDPATNELIHGAPTGRRRTNNPEVHAWTAERLAVLGGFIGHGFTPEDVQALHSTPGDAWRQRLILLACWLEKHQTRLSGTTPPWW